MMMTTIINNGGGSGKTATQPRPCTRSRLLLVSVLAFVGVFFVVDFLAYHQEQQQQHYQQPEWRRRTQDTDDADDTDTSGSSSSGGPIYPHEEEGHIINGQDAADGEYPFYVKFEGGVLCGGSLLSENRVLTAGHCIKDFGWPSHVRVGPTTKVNGEVRAVKCGVVHPNYLNPFLTVLADVAILKLEEPVESTTEFVQLRREEESDALPLQRSNNGTEDDGPEFVTLNEDDEYPEIDGQQLTVIGFGRQADGSTSSTLKKVNTKFVTRENCLNKYNDAVVRPDAHLCADVEGAGDCNGDSGGPLMDMDKKQVGVVSFGYGGCASEYQDVYAKVSSYVNWIDGEMRNETCPDPPPASDNSGGGGFCGIKSSMWKYVGGVALERVFRYIGRIYGPPEEDEPAPSEFLP